MSDLWQLSSLYRLIHVIINCSLIGYMSNTCISGWLENLRGSTTSWKEALETLISACLGPCCNNDANNTQNVQWVFRMRNTFIMILISANESRTSLPPHWNADSPEKAWFQVDGDLVHHPASRISFKTSPEMVTLWLYSAHSAIQNSGNGPCHVDGFSLASHYWTRYCTHGEAPEWRVCHLFCLWNRLLSWPLWTHSRTDSGDGVIFQSLVEEPRDFLLICQWSCSSKTIQTRKSRKLKVSSVRMFHV